MTTARRFGEDRSDFGVWLRNCPSLDSRNGYSFSDVDWVIHQFMTHQQHGRTKQIQNIMFVEEKSRDEKLRFAQSDTLSVAAICLNSLQKFKVKRLKIPRRGRMVLVRHWGYHLLRFSGDGPLDSDIIQWDHKRIALADLELLMQFKLSPWTLKPRDERSHHGGARQRSLY